MMGFSLISLLEETLKKDTRFVTVDGVVNKVKVRDAVMREHIDKDLLKNLMSEPKIKETFFDDADGIVVFDKSQFLWVLNNNQFVADSYTQYSQKITLTDSNGNSIKDNGDVTLSFPYKDCVLLCDTSDSDKQRDEIFLNTTLAKKDIDVLFDKKALTNQKRYVAVQQPDGSWKTEVQENISDFDLNKDNLIIKGNNLLALKSLMKTKYAGKIKLMYWDILYNTDSDQVPYNDRFKHSSWLVMMKNRLEAAKALLAPDGVICLQCDNNEDAYLKVLADEVFGRGNYINTISIKSSTISGSKTAHKEKTVLKSKDSLLIYKKGNTYIRPQYEERTRWDTHYSHFLTFNSDGTITDESLVEYCRNHGIIEKKEKLSDASYYNKNFMEWAFYNREKIFRLVGSINKDAKKYSLEHKDEVVSYTYGDAEDPTTVLCLNGKRLSPLTSSIKNIDGKEALAQLLGDLWTDISFDNTQNEGGKDIHLPAGQKPEALLRRIIDMFTNEGDIVLDAYLGSGTTAAVAQKMNRRYIGIEQLDKHMEMAVKRLTGILDGSDQSGISKTVKWQGGGSFVYCELAKDGQRLVDKIMAADKEDLLGLFDEVKNSDFITYKANISRMDKEGFKELSEEDRRKILLSVIDNNTLYVNARDIEEYHELSDSIAFTKAFYER